MGFLDRLFGTEPSPQRPQQKRAAPPSSDEQALQRYRYMLQTAPPETIEQAHQEAFAKLTPEQRQQVLSELARTAPASESAAIARTPVDDTRALARVATRAEIRQPGTMERTLGGAGMGLGASLLSSFAMGFVGSMVANSFFSAMGGFGHDAASHDTGAEGDAHGDDTQQADYEHDGDDFGGGDDYGDGGDFGGGDDFA
jgi:hypothetical protein